MDKYLDQTNSREKLCRLVQFSSRLLQAAVTRGQPAGSFAQSLRSLELSCAEARKILLFGNQSKDVQSVMVLKERDPILRPLTLLRHFFNLWFVSFDNLDFLGKHSLQPLLDKGRVGRVRGWSWLMRLLVTILLELILVFRTFKRSQALALSLTSALERRRILWKSSGNEDQLTEATSEVETIKRSAKDSKDLMIKHAMSALTNAVDVPLAIDAAGLRTTPLSVGTSGFLGVLSTLLLLKGYK